MHYEKSFTCAYCVKETHTYSPPYNWIRASSLALMFFLIWFECMAIKLSQKLSRFKFRRFCPQWVIYIWRSGHSMWQIISMPCSLRRIHNTLLETPCTKRNHHVSAIIQQYKIMMSDPLDMTVHCLNIVKIMAPPYIRISFFRSLTLPEGLDTQYDYHLYAL